MASTIRLGKPGPRMGTCDLRDKGLLQRCSVECSEVSCHIPECNPDKRQPKLCSRENRITQQKELVLLDATCDLSKSSHLKTTGQRGQGPEGSSLLSRGLTARASPIPASGHCMKLFLKIHLRGSLLQGPEFSWRKWWLCFLQPFPPLFPALGHPQLGWQFTR